ncbi:MAG: trypsin-like peptidase domain-containing protein [Sphingopyxis sp.]
MRNANATIAALLLGGTALAMVSQAPLGAQVTADTPSTTAIVPRAGAPASFADLTAQLQPAVVNISTSQRVQISPQANPFAGTPFEGLFGQRGGDGNGNGGGQPQTRRGQSLGSGFIISADGYIVTNNHVVSPGAPNAVVTQITVTMPDRTEYVARLVGRDPDSDLAVLKIEARGLPHVSFGDSTGARVGDWVIAIGNPLGFGGTVTSGIVSALYRNVGPAGIGTGGAFDRYIQTDAAINQGNSGGPMFDMSGRVIGINSAIISPNGGSIGLGFAIPSEVAEPIVRQLIAGQTIARGYLGIERAPLTEDLASSLGIERSHGEFVQRVVPDGAADRAGIRPGDVVLRINNLNVTPDNNLSFIVANIAPGTRVPVELIRDGRRMTVNATVATRPSAEELAASTPNFDPEAQEDFGTQEAPKPGADTTIRTQLGIVTQALTEEIARQIGVDAATRGVVIATLSPSSDAAAKQLRRGDIILNAHGRAITSNDDLAAAITEAKRQGRSAILVQVLRRGVRPQYIPLVFEN